MLLATNTCMLKMQSTIYHFLVNIDDKKIVSNESLIIAFYRLLTKTVTH